MTIEHEAILMNHHSASVLHAAFFVLILTLIGTSFLSSVYNYNGLRIIFKGKMKFFAEYCMHDEKFE